MATNPEAKPAAPPGANAQAPKQSPDWRQLVASAIASLRSKPLLWGIWLAYVTLMALTQLRHEPWRDEVHCFLVGKHASGLMDVLNGERRYDGHPYLWYWITHLLSRVSSSPSIMQVFVVLCNAVTGYLVLFRTPLRPLERVLLVFSHYFAYDYAVVCRGYVVGTLLTVLFCAAYQPNRVRFKSLALILALLSATSAYGTVIAIAFGMFLFGHRIGVESQSSRGVYKFAITREWLAGLGIFVFGLLVTVTTSIPPADAHFSQPWGGGFFTESALRSALERYAIGNVPIPSLHTIETWNSSFVNQMSPATRSWVPWFGLALLLAWTLALARRPLLFIPFLFGTLVMAYFQQVKYWGGVRHWGHFFVLGLGCLMLAVKAGGRRVPKRGASTLLGLQLGVQLVSGYLVLSNDWKHPFSDAKATAEFLRTSGYGSHPLVGGFDHMVSNVAGWLDAEVLYPDTGETAQVVVFHKRRRSSAPSAQLAAAVGLAESTGKEPVIISTAPITATVTGAYNVEPIYQSPPTIAGDERFYLYVLRAR